MVEKDNDRIGVMNKEQADCIIAVEKAMAEERESAEEAAEEKEAHGKKEDKFSK